MESVLQDLDLAQLFILSGSILLPSLLILLPAVHGSMTTIGDAFRFGVLLPAGMVMPTNLSWALSVLIPMLASACFAASLVQRYQGQGRWPSRASS